MTQKSNSNGFLFSGREEKIVGLGEGFYALPTGLLKWLPVELKPWNNPMHCVDIPLANKDVDFYEPWVFK